MLSRALNNFPKPSYRKQCLNIPPFILISDVGTRFFITVKAYKKTHSFFRMKFLAPTCYNQAPINISVWVKQGKCNDLHLAVEVNIISAGFAIQHTSQAFIHAFWTVVQQALSQRVPLLSLAMGSCIYPSCLKLTETFGESGGSC